MKTYTDIFDMMRYAMISYEYAMISYECVPAVLKNYCCAYCSKNKYCGVDTIILSIDMLYNY